MLPPSFACLWRPSQAPQTVRLADVAAAFSPRYEEHDDTLISIDVSGLERLIRPSRAGLLRSPGRAAPAGLQHPAKTGQATQATSSARPRPIGLQVIGDALWDEMAARGTRAHIAVAGTRTAALVLAYARPGLVVVAPGDEAAALASIRLEALEPFAAQIHAVVTAAWGRPSHAGADAARGGLAVFAQWGVRTLGELAALPPADLAARLGSRGAVWQAVARGEDTTPLVPTLPDERFEGSVELEWPMEGLEPLSFVLTRLLEPIVVRLERRDRGAAVVHVRLDLTTRDAHVRHLQLPAPLRDVRTLRSLILLDLESHPPPAAIDRVTLVIDPTPGRVLQHALFTRAQPAPERISTLLARLGALMGQDRIGAPAAVDSYRPGAFAMRPFAADRPDTTGQAPEPCAVLTTALVHRYRRPVPARVTMDQGRPVRVTTDRRGVAGGQVVRCAGPWRASGEWWAEIFDRDEWDVSLADGAVYRLACDRQTKRWFIDAIVD
jgi:protein ImuB